MNETLQKAYDILEAKGWCQGVHQDGRGQVCLEGAFALAVGCKIIAGLPENEGQMDAPEAQQAWLNLVYTVEEETGFDVPYNWNDHPSTTVEDVKLILKKAIGREAS